MTADDSRRAAVEATIKNCYSTWSESYYRDYYQSSDAYPPVHTGIVRAELSAAKPATLIDVGCGPASMLRDLADLGIDLYGFDLTPEMVVEARRVVGTQGLAADRIWEGSVLDLADYRVPTGGYGAAICFGVLPHIPAATDGAVLANLTAAVKPGGLVLLEARNQLFALFTQNRYSRELFRDVLIDEARLRARAGDDAAALDAAFAELDKRFRMDLPPVRKGKADEPGYDEVLSRTHNPFELKALAGASGLVDVEVLFYHYHCLPPMLERHAPRFVRDESVAMEDPRDWRGHFMASAFILKGRRRAS